MRMPAPPSTDDQYIWDLWLSMVWQPAIVAAQQLGIFHEIDKNPARAETLAEKMQLDTKSTRIVTTLLTALRLLELREGKLHLSDQAKIYFLEESPFYWGHMFKNAVSEWHFKAICESLQNKNRPLSRAALAWSTGQMDNTQAEGIAAAMQSHSLNSALGVARSEVFKNVKRLLDVGGGSGCFAIALGQMNPQLKCTIMELPAMCAVANKYIEAAQAENQVDAIAVDMFREPWPKGYDALFFSNIFHDWKLDVCKKLAEQAYSTLPSGGQIFLHEMLIHDDDSGPLTTAAFSLFMLIKTQGQQFSFQELKNLLEHVGFTNVSQSKAKGYYSLVSAVKK